MKKYIMIAAGALLMQYAQAQTIDRTQQPKPGPAPVLTIKDPVKYILPNGITLLVVENHSLPKVTANYLIDLGPVTEGSKAGVVSLMGQMLNEGTKTMPKAVFDESVEKLGANVRLSSSSAYVSALTRYFKEAFTLMGQGLKDPAFTQESFDKLKSQEITGLKSSAKSAAAISGRVNNALVYGKTHPNGEFETEESIQALTVQDIKDAYAKYVTPSRGYLTIVGDIKPAEAKALATEVLGNWKGAALTLPTLPIVANPAKTEIDVVDVPSAVQTEINVINLVDIKKNNPDYFAVILASYILGGGAESRLFMNLREKHGFTYGAYSELGTGRWQETFDASASVRNAKVDSAVTEMLNEIKRIRTDKVTDEELNTAKALYNGSFALNLEDPARTATFASNILINDLPADFYKTYLQKVNAVTADDILRVSQKYFNYDNTRVVIVGGSAQFMDGLKKSGYPIKMYDKFANPVVEGAQTAAVPDVKPADIIKGYIDAIGGATELKKVTSYTTTSDMAMQGMKLSVLQKKMAPNMEAMTISMGGNVVMKQDFDGSKGYQQQGPNKKDLSADEIAQKKVFTSLTEQLDYLTNPAFKLAVKGIQKVNGADAYQVSVTDPTGKISTEYYDVKSKLLVKNESTTTSGATTVNVTVDYGDYRKVGSVMFPYKQTITQSAGGQEQTFEMTVTDIKLNTGVTADDFK
ncbi:insulinase family protein [Mucilaginibacter sp. BJC16-A38]|uniref:M16 family metallopeptidase n=1 Tax=Mucilaginibacter phenanthrenivorans TaxID=1234842 RepID=UPI002157EFF5|nr:pitrilysin family protein [Mucilaginibacter phenanthrenivorans]MCR8561766.1 insulinase family protein [Mucilaginibacter phenanthrenivorans]